MMRRRCIIKLRRTQIIFILFVVIFTTLEIRRTLMLMRTAIIVVVAQCVLNIPRRELVQLFFLIKDDDGDVDRAKY